MIPLALPGFGAAPRAPAGRCLFIMLNPSTADAVVDDPTIRRCIGFARSWGFGATLAPERSSAALSPCGRFRYRLTRGELDIANLFAFRSTDPRELARALERGEGIIGPENDSHIADLARSASVVVVAWGTHGELLNRGAKVLAALRAQGIEPACLGLTKDRHPKHPLYLAANTPIREVRA